MADSIRELTAGLRSLLPDWNRDPNESLRYLGVSENVLFLVGDGTERSRLVLRVHRPGYHGEAEILSELAWLTALHAERVVTVPRAVSTANGDLLRHVRDGAVFRAVVAFDYLPGVEPDSASDRLGCFTELGAIAARLHGHARRWQRPAGFTRKRWTFDTILGHRAYWGDWRANGGIEASGRAVLERLQGRLHAECAVFGQDEARFGLVHSDMRAANLLVQDGRLTVIDFDDCGFSWFAFDFAAAVSFIEHDPILPALRDAWLDGYRRIAPFSAQEERALPMLTMLRRMQLTAWTASHPETATALALGPDFAAGTVELAEGYLTRGDAMG